jgi:pimeloyl-ACP methyl ester carboxylesterase
MIRDAETRSMMRAFFENNRISERRVGVRNDIANVNAMNSFKWEEINVPTLLIHGDKDHLIPLEYSREVARHIPGAKLVLVQGGGHECLVSHHREISPKLALFLEKHAAK